MQRSSKVISSITHGSSDNHKLRSTMSQMPTLTVHLLLRDEKIWTEIKQNLFRKPSTNGVIVCWSLSRCGSRPINVNNFSQSDALYCYLSYVICSFQYLWNKVMLWYVLSQCLTDKINAVIGQLIKSSAEGTKFYHLTNSALIFRCRAKINNFVEKLHLCTHFSLFLFTWQCKPFSI